MRRRRRLAGVAALAALALTPASAGAVDGALYPYGPSIWAASPYWSGTALAGSVWRIQAGAQNPAHVHNVWEMNWGCPVGGSEIHAVQFGALRTQAASSLAVQVTGDRRTLWSEGDAAMPQSPAGGRGYDVRLPGGQCNVHLALTQVESRAQHARGYFIDNPRILVRDLTAPGVLLRGLTAGWINAGAGRARVEWTASDNFGSDGMGPHRIDVGGRTVWSGTAGAGDHGVDVSLDGVGDGVYGTQVVVAGDGTGPGVAGGVLHIDRTAPSATGLTSSSPGQPGSVGLGWRIADNLSGPAASHVDVNAAPDGSTSGTWETVAGASGTGPHAATIARIGVPDGVHAWRVRSADVAGNSGVTAATGRIVVDTTPPRLELHSAPTGWVRGGELDLTATDNLQGTLGLGPIEIDVNAAVDGGEGGRWVRRGAAAAAPGRRIVPLDLGGLADGRHLVRVVVRNGGPFSSALATERRTVIRVDASSPQIARAVFAPSARSMAVSWIADDAASGVASATVQWRDGTAWRTIAAQGARDGAGAMTVDVSTLPEGDRAFRLVVTDAAGNSAVRTATARVSGSPGTGTAPDPFARLRGARLVVAVPGARAQRRGPRTVLVRRLRSGTPLTITGLLRDARGRAIAREEVWVRGHRGARLGRAVTGADGRFRIALRPAAGGLLRVGVPAGRELLPARASADIRAEVRPWVSAAASALVVPGGRQVVFTGRVRPAPGEIGLGSHKGVVLEWRDPVRRTWRPVLNARLRRDGSFAIPWVFNLSGLTIPMRVAVPAEVGWPLLPARSSVIRVTVR